MCIAIRVNSDKSGDSRNDYYSCSECRAMFKPIIFFEKWDFFDCLPRVCPNCGKPFKNGMSEI